MAAGISTRNRATMERSYLLLKLKACAGQRVTLFERLDWKTPCLMHTLVNQLRPSHKDTWEFYASVDGLSLGTIKSRRYSFLKSAWRDHTLDVMYKLHKIDITTAYCIWVGMHPYKKKQRNLVYFADTCYSALFIVTTYRYYYC